MSDLDGFSTDRATSVERVKLQWPSQEVECLHVETEAIQEILLKSRKPQVRDEVAQQRLAAVSRSVRNNMMNL